MRLRLSSVRTKLLLVTAALTFIPLATAGSYIFFVVPGLLEEDAREHLANQVAAKRATLLQLTRDTEENLQFLRQMPAMTQLLEASRDGMGVAAWLEQTVAEDWASFSETRKRYYQIRYIDGSGYERVRVDRLGEEALIVPPSLLQNKANRYYFVGTMGLGAKDVFVSPIDLNQEYGQIEVPYRPVIRYAAPVFRQEGTRAGIVILNLDATPLLEVVNEPNSPGYRSFLADEDGYYTNSSE